MNIGPVVTVRRRRHAFSKDFAVGCYQSDFEIRSAEVDADNLFFLANQDGFLPSRNRVCINGQRTVNYYKNLRGQKQGEKPVSWHHPSVELIAAACVPRARLLLGTARHALTMTSVV